MMYWFLRHKKENKIYWDYPEDYKFCIKKKITNPEDYEIFKKINSDKRLKDININGLIGLFDLSQFRRLNNK